MRGFITHAAMCLVSLSMTAIGAYTLATVPGPLPTEALVPLCGITLAGMVSALASALGMVWEAR